MAYPGFYVGGCSTHRSKVLHGVVWITKNALYCKSLYLHAEHECRCRGGCWWLPKLKAAGSGAKYYLHARVPVLSGLVRQPWEALVIDNPGFLDTIPRIAEIPLKALSVSSVVVLVIHGFQITAKMNMDCYKQAFEKDPGKAYTYLPTIPVFQDYPEFSASFPAVLLDS